MERIVSALKETSAPHFYSAIVVNTVVVVHCCVTVKRQSCRVIREERTPSVRYINLSGSGTQQCSGVGIISVQGCGVGS